MHGLIFIHNTCPNLFCILLKWTCLIWCFVVTNQSTKDDPLHIQLGKITRITNQACMYFNRYFYCYVKIQFEYCTKKNWLFQFAVYINYSAHNNVINIVMKEASIWIIIVTAIYFIFSQYICIYSSEFRLCILFKPKVIKISRDSFIIKWKQQFA